MQGKCLQNAYNKACFSLSKGDFTLYKAEFFIGEGKFLL